MTLRASIRQLIACVRHPFRHFPIAPNFLLSPLDAIAEKSGIEMVEDVFRRPRVASVGRALARFFRDPEAERALKKSVHVIFEQRLRHRALLADPPERHGLSRSGLEERPGPLDWEAERHLAGRTGMAELPLTGPAPNSLLQLWGYSLFWGAALLASVVHIGLCRAKVDSRVQKVDIAFPNFGPLAKLKPLQQVLSRDVPEPNFACILEQRGWRAADVPFPTIDPSRLRVPLLYWWLSVVPSAFLLILETFWQMAGTKRDALAVFVLGEALHLSVTAVRIWPIALNLKFGAYLDNEEYSALHNVKAMLFRRHAAGPLVRWPLSQIDSTGCLLSYLGYDLFLSTGPYQAQTYSDTWSPRMKTHSIGQLQWDSRFADKHLVDPDLRQAIEAKLTAGMRMIAFFGPSSVMGAPEIAIKTLDTVLAEIERHPNIFLVIKPKINADLIQLIEREAATQPWLLHPRVIMVRYPERGVEICPVGFLLDLMAIGVGGLGSTQLEALTKGKPYLSYFPVMPDTELRRKMMHDGLSFDDLGRFRTRLAELLAGDASPSLAWYGAAIDPFADDRAISRAAMRLNEFLSPTEHDI